MLSFVSRKKYQELEERYRAKCNEAEINYSRYTASEACLTAEVKKTTRLEIELLVYKEKYANEIQKRLALAEKLGKSEV